MKKYEVEDLIDYIGKYKKINEHNLKVIKKNIGMLQGMGAYPVKMNYPITLQFELTGTCNLSCKHCYNRSGDQDRETLMTPDKWCELSRQIVKDGGIFQCILSGGEPLLLGNSLFDIMDILHDDGTSFIVITNAFLLTKEKVERFRKYRFLWFQISIDGADRKTHDSFRGVDGSFDRAVTGAMEISNAGIPLVIAHSVTPFNLSQLDDMVDLAYQLGANSIIIGDIMPSGRAIENQEIILNETQKNFLYEKIEKLRKEYADKISVQRSSDLKSQMARYEIEVNQGGIIRPNGDFRIDCMAPFVIGNVLHERIKNMWIEKGIDAWESSKVQNYIASIDEVKDEGNIRNHVDQDILI